MSAIDAKYHSSKINVPSYFSQGVDQIVKADVNLSLGTWEKSYVS